MSLTLRLLGLILACLHLEVHGASLHHLSRERASPDVGKRLHHMFETDKMDFREKNENEPVVPLPQNEHGCVGLNSQIGGAGVKIEGVCWTTNGEKDPAHLPQPIASDPSQLQVKWSAGRPGVQAAPPAGKLWLSAQFDKPTNVFGIEVFIEMYYGAEGPPAVLHPTEVTVTTKYENGQPITKTIQTGVHAWKNGENPLPPEVLNGKEKLQWVEIAIWGDTISTVGARVVLKISPPKETPVKEAGTPQETEHVPVPKGVWLACPSWWRCPMNPRRDSFPRHFGLEIRDSSSSSSSGEEKFTEIMKERERATALYPNLAFQLDKNKRATLGYSLNRMIPHALETPGGAPRPVVNAYDVNRQPQQNW